MKIERITVGQMQTNCYLLYDEVQGKGIIVDPGSEADKITAAVRKRNIGVTHIVLTHGHYDHIMALWEVKQAYPSALVCLCRAEKDFINNPSQSLTLYMDKPFPPVTPDILLKEGDLIQVGDTSLRVMETPGHTAGSICLYGGGILISGDTLFYMGMGRCDLPTGDLKSEVDSILRKLFCLKDATVVYPGHGPETTIGFEKAHNEVYHYAGMTE